MKRVHLKPYQQRNVQIGLRLFFASLLIAICSGSIASMIMAAMIMLFPAWGYNPRVLATGGGEEQEKALLDKIQKQVKKLMEESQLEGVTKDQLNKSIESINKEIAKLSNEGMADLKKKMDDMAKANEQLVEDLKKANESLLVQSTEIKKLKENGEKSKENDEVRKTFRQALKEAFLEKKDIFTEKNDDYGKRLSLKSFFEKGNRRTPEFTIKAPVDMLQSNIVGANVNPIRLTELDPQRVGIPLTIYPHVMDVFRVKGISRPYMSLLVVYSYEDGTATKVEGAASGLSSFLLKTVEFKSFYIATHFVLSDETLDDLEEVLDEISIVAPDKIMDRVDLKILGTAGDDIADIQGLRNAAKSTAFSAAAGLGALSVDNATIVDVISSAKLQCENNKYRPTHVYLNAAEVGKLAAEKNTFQDSKTDRRVTYNALGYPVAVCGLIIVQTTAIPANTAIVFDYNQPWIGRRKDMTMEIGYNATDLTEGQKTVVIKIRAAFGVRDKAGVIYIADITAAKAALETA